MTTRVISACYMALLTMYQTCVYAASDDATPPKLQTYIVAHPDDWQLFMGDEAFAQIVGRDHVIFIYLTAGGADRPPAY